VAQPLNNKVPPTTANTPPAEVTVLARFIFIKNRSGIKNKFILEINIRIASAGVPFVYLMEYSATSQTYTLSEDLPNSSLLSLEL
jgi:hypothetical protein